MVSFLTFLFIGLENDLVTESRGGASILVLKMNFYPPKKLEDTRGWKDENAGER